MNPNERTLRARTRRVAKTLAAAGGVFLAASFATVEQETGERLGKTSGYSVEAQRGLADKAAGPVAGQDLNLRRKRAAARRR